MLPVAADEKMAATIVAAPGVTVHVPVPEQPPPSQPRKVEPAAGVAVKVTTEPGLKEALQVFPQMMPAGEDVTVPRPVPNLVRVKTAVLPKVAVTAVALFIVTVHVPVPEQPPPDQPVNMEPAAGVAVNVTTVPAVKA